MRFLKLLQPRPGAKRKTLCRLSALSPEQTAKGCLSACGLSHGLTKSTSGMSSPLAATSVATSAVNFPLRKFFNTCSRWFCEMSPCRACAETEAHIKRAFINLPATDTMQLRARLCAHRYAGAHRHGASPGSENLVARQYLAGVHKRQGCCHLISLTLGLGEYNRLPTQSMDCQQVYQDTPPGLLGHIDCHRPAESYHITMCVEMSDKQLWRLTGVSGLLKNRVENFTAPYIHVLAQYETAH